MSLTTHLKRVLIKDYRSIAGCDVRLQPLTFLVGPNGSGKSNFLDALRFLADALRGSLDQALRDRGGINEVRRRSHGRPNHFAIRLQLDIEDLDCDYSFEIAARSSGNYYVRSEVCESSNSVDDSLASFTREDTKVKNGSHEILALPKPSSDRLFLPIAANLPGFDRLHGVLSTMGFYNLDVAKMRDLQPPDAGDLLRRDGSNLTAVLTAMAKRNPERRKRLEEFLALVVPGVVSVQRKQLGPRETLEFVERADSKEKGRHFLAASMSDGTLRALGILAALFQSPDRDEAIPLIGIEEPEMALHPAAAGVLFDCLKEASAMRQVLVTSHSPDLLDREDIPSNSVLAVTMDAGRSIIAPIDRGGLRVLKSRLRTPGELLRLNQLNPDRSQVPEDQELKLLMQR